MALRCAILMDPIESIKPVKDTSFALLLEAQRRSYDLRYIVPGSIGLRQGDPIASVAPITVRDASSAWFSLGEAEDTDLTDLDVVLVRTDPPVDANYIYATQILEIAQTRGVQVVNDPRGLRDLNEKLAALLFPDLCPPTRVSRQPEALKAFVAEHGLCVLKPLDGMGGHSIFRTAPDDPNLPVILETLTEHGQRQTMAQKFLPAIVDGDKRVLLIDGEPVPYGLSRIPQGIDFRGNLAVGGRGEGRPLTEREREIAAIVGPEMKRRGMLFVGLDVIGDWLTEVNVTSPTCVRELDSRFGLNIAGLLFDAIEARRPTR